MNTKIIFIKHCIYWSKNCLRKKNMMIPTWKLKIIVLQRTVWKSQANHFVPSIYYLHYQIHSIPSEKKLIPSTNYKYLKKIMVKMLLLLFFCMMGRIVIFLLESRWVYIWRALSLSLLVVTIFSFPSYKWSILDVLGCCNKA